MPNLFQMPLQTLDLQVLIAALYIFGNDKEIQEKMAKNPLNVVNTYLLTFLVFYWYLPTICLGGHNIVHTPMSISPW